MKDEVRDFLDGINTKQGKAWEKVYESYYSPLCHYAFKIVSDQDKAINVVQGAIVSLWEMPLHFEHLAEFNLYLYRTVHNNCLKEIRDRNREERYLKEWASLSDELDSETLSAVVFEEVVRKLHSLIDKMPPKRKEVILLCLKNKTNEEIAGELGISVNTVKKHKKEAYAVIKETVRMDLFLCVFFSERF